MSTSFYVYETQMKPIRKCGVCNRRMDEGFIEEETGRLWCDELCLRTDYDSIEQRQAHDVGSLFWTTWYDELEDAE